MKKIIKVNEDILQKILKAEINSFSLKSKKQWIDIYFKELECKVENGYLVLIWSGWNEPSFISKNTLKIHLDIVKFDTELELLSSNGFEANFKNKIEL